MSKLGRRLSPRLWIAVVLTAATFALYAPVRQFSFLNYDDPDYVTRNLHVRGGLTADGVAWALRSTEAANWFPLTWLTHMLDVQLFGLNSGLHHLTNVLLHTASAVLLFLLLARISEAIWPSAFVAAIFALHPLHVESVAWIAERKDVLSALFWMLALLAYVRYVARRTAGRYALLLLAFLAGLMSKPMMVTFPLVALLLDFWPLRRPWTPALLVEKAPMFGLSAAVSILVFVAQRSAGAVLTVNQLPFTARLANALVSYAVYTIKLVWPSGLAVFYPFPISLPLWPAIVAGILIALVTAVLIHQRSQRPWLLVGWLWYVVTLLPVIGLVQVGLQSRADRYTYLPLIGLSIVLAWGVAELAGHHPRILATIAIVVLAAWTTAARFYLADWRDSAALFHHALNSTTGNYVAHNNLGVALRDHGDLGSAIANFRAALALRPEYAEARNNMGEAWLKQGRLADAAVEIAEALRLNPSLSDAHVNYGAILSKQGHTDEALSQYRLALQLDPADADAHEGLGAILTDLGRSDEALSQLLEAARLKPDSAGAHYNLGRLYGLSGRTADAVTEFSRAAALRPDDPQVHYNLGLALAYSEQLNAAIREFQTAIRLFPGYASAHMNLGAALAQAGNCAAAAPEFAEALRLRPEMQEARNNLEACRQAR